jgi:hypothetical protein
MSGTGRERLRNQFHQDFSSMLMVSFFAVSVISYAAGLFVTGRRDAV